jgi:hypothetical protein
MSFVRAIALPALLVLAMAPPAGADTIFFANLTMSQEVPPAVNR